MKKTPCFASFSYWGVHWLKLAPELKKVPGGKTTTHNILFGPILTNFEEIFEIGDDDFGGRPTLPVRKISSSPLPSSSSSSLGPGDSDENNYDIKMIEAKETEGEKYVTA